MTIISDLAATNDIAMAVAGALEQLLGEDVILAVGMPRQDAPGADSVPDGAVRAVAMPFVDGIGGEIALIVRADFALAIEAAAPDEALATGAISALQAGVDAIIAAADEDVTAGVASEVEPAELIGPRAGDFLVYPLLQGNERAATIIIRIAGIGTGGLATQSTNIAVHEFQPLDDGTGGLMDPRPLNLLQDVEMGVTAELGRRRMTVRELLSLTPGSVIELDRAAGSPVDVLVNGTLIARGEVVVIDEEFGIRIAEIVAAENSAH